ncbi:hypothetical protein NQ314_005161 [Rhamnusium bicolor]|uniref:BESS domain-containing protein n=1 Tax=Rhamnusium bicolor TaxID=1586634 RepID=A0AAV8ZHS0_9CUCU|nr:hypothetical protein NQ314_005161 [Rhamnusium bicolor]
MTNFSNTNKLSNSPSCEVIENTNFQAENLNSTTSTAPVDLQNTPKSMKRKQPDHLERTFIEMIGAITRQLNKKTDIDSEDVDEQFCRYITAELKRKDEETKKEIKKKILSLFFDFSV